MHKKPVIVIMINNCSSGSLKEIQAGIEEEGLIYETKEGKSNRASKLAFEAASLSALDVGIGISEKEACVHVRNLEVDKPLFKVEENNAHCMRDIGANAARYIKGIPFINVKQVIL